MGDSMAIEKNHIKTSIFLTLLMILTPLAAASTVTTFADGSSEVSIEFKDGVNSYNNTGGGFSVPNDETITSAKLEIPSNAANHSFYSRNGIEQPGFTWDPAQNNGLTTVSNSSNFNFAATSNGATALSSESIVNDFESDNGNYVNASQDVNSNTNEPNAWEYDYLKYKQLTNGPEECASGDMCWGTCLLYTSPSPRD